MERPRLNTRARCSGSTPSEESALDLERNCCGHSNLPSLSPPTLQPFASAGQHCESNAAYFSWPSRLNDAAEERANYFLNLQKGVLPETLGRLPKGQQATTLLELMTIRAFHSKILRCYSLGTAIGFRIRRGVLTDIPAILVFVSRKSSQAMAQSNPVSAYCSRDVVEFSYFGAPEPVPKEQLYTDMWMTCVGVIRALVQDLRCGKPGDLWNFGCHVRSQTGSRQVGFLTNRHVAVDLDYPNQKMFHPLPPTLGPGVYLGAVERATSFITDELWYGIFAGINPETFVRADGAFIPFADDFDMSTVTTSVRGVGDMVGRSSGLTTGIVLAYALEYNDEKGICFLTDFLVVGENQQTFDLEGDSGSLIMLKGAALKLKIGQPPENWTSGVDLGRLLNLLELDLITTDEGLRVAVCKNKRAASATVIGSTVGDSSTPDGILPKDKAEDKFEPLGLQIQSIPLGVEPSSQDMKPSIMETEFKLEDGIKVVPSIEHQFIPSFTGRSPLHKNSTQDRAATENLSSLRNGCDEDLCVSLQLGDNEAKRRRSEASTSTEEP
ncbi:Peptidase S1, PA clan [Sesbania bispinosa]|nr:Peptidase S1, PA clan [Sesbania bispinosa]